MREIKFRGRKTGKKEFIEGSLVMVCNGETLKRYPCIVVSYNHDTFDWHEVVSETVGQYTGLKDKNGKEIYEGDIVKVYNWGTSSDKILSISQIVWDIDYYHFTIDPDPIDDRYDFCKSANFEIIGNIYENPELIGE